MNSTKFINIQGTGFCALVALFTVLVSATNILNGSSGIIFLSLMICTLGLPHGALDTLFAKNRFQLNSLKDWIFFIIAYLAVAAVVLQIWLIFPVIFLLTFLLISVFHFSGDLQPGISIFSRILYGGGIIFLPTLLHHDEVLRLFSFLVKTDQIKTLVSGMRLVAGPWVLFLAIASYAELKKNRMASFEMLSVAVLAIAVSPLAAFTIYFCGMHSARHIIKMSSLMKTLSPTTFRIFLAACVLPTLAVCLVGVVVWFIPTENSIDARLIQMIFVGLAALTVPHMILLDNSEFIRKILGKVSSRRDQNLHQLKQSHRRILY